MQLASFLNFLAVALPVVYGAPTSTANALHPRILEAMKRDLGLEAEAATARILFENKATETVETLTSSVGDVFAGAWISEDGTTLTVGLTDESKADEVKAAGAEVSILANSLSKLQKAQADLDALDIEQPTTLEGSEETGIAAYYVDVLANKFVIEALAASKEHAASLAAEVGLSEGEFEVRTVSELPKTMATIQGGSAYYMGGGGRCSIGFSVTTGFATAGHCGTVGTGASTSSGESLGSFAGSSFPGDDMAYVETSGGHTLSGTINGYGSGNLPVTGSSAAPVGSSICRSGSTTGVHCGTVQALGTSVSYPEGRVNGVTQTSVCAEPGDSGGAYYVGGSAQGVTSGGSGNCASGGTTYFQPIGPLLSAYGLTLVTS